jgi:hypothetical protein
VSYDDVQLLLLVGLAYFAPLCVAAIRHHHQLGAIAVVNVLLGWTFVGWVVALAMACSAVKPPEVPAHLAQMPPPDPRDRLG